MLAIRSREVGGRDFPHEGQVVAVVGDVVPGTGADGWDGVSRAEQR
jgi:hypothetical protein